MGRTATPTGRPVIPVKVMESTDELVFYEDDRAPRSPVHMVLSEFDVGRLAAGYICLQCKEDLDVAFPDECPVCHYRMAERQAEDFAKQFKGTTHLGPSTTIADERMIMDELREREAREAGALWTPKIAVPRSI